MSPPFACSRCYSHDNQATARRVSAGFTLVELLVVIVIIAILAALLLPVLNSGKHKAQTIACVNQLKQFAIAAQMYAADHNGFLVPNSPTSGTNGWVGGDMKHSVQAAEPVFLQHGRLFPYVGQTTVFRCPADRSTATTGRSRVRSYAMNSWLGSRAMETTYPTAGRGFRTFVKDAEFSGAGAATLWLLADEHEQTIDDGFFLVTMDDSQPLASFPALRHQRRFTLSFVDGHAEFWKLRDANTDWKTQAQVGRNNIDWLRLKQATTVAQ